MRFLPLIFLFGCSGSAKDTTTGTLDSETDADTDTDTDTDSDADSDSEAPATGSISGTVVSFDGSTPAGVEVQVCDLVCFSVETGAGGAFLKEELEDGSFKVDAIGSTIGDNIGTIRMHVDLAADQQFAIPAPLYMPEVIGPKNLSSAGAVFGEVTVKADPANLNLPFGAEEGQFWAGLVPGDKVPPFWGVTPAVAVAFLPIATEVTGTIGVSVAGSYAAGNYDVYSVDDHGAVEGPVGAATSDGSVLTGEGLAPKFLVWLLFVPK